MDNFASGLERMLEATSFYQSISLLHLVLKSEVEAVIVAKEIINQEMTKLLKASNSYILDI